MKKVQVLFYLFASFYTPFVGDSTTDYRVKDNNYGNILGKGNSYLRCSSEGRLLILHRFHYLQ